MRNVPRSKSDKFREIVEFCEQEMPILANGDYDRIERVLNARLKARPQLRIESGVGVSGRSKLK